MKNLFELSEDEKNSIRGLHESYKHKPGTKLIWEQDTTLTQSVEFDVYYFGVPGPKTEKIYHDGNKIYYFDGENNREIWSKGETVSYAFNDGNKKYETGSELMDAQQDLQNIFKQFLVKSFGPLQYQFENQKLPTYYMIMFGDEGKMFLNATAPVVISRAKAKQDGLVKAKNEDGYYYANYKKSYIPLKRKNALITEIGFGRQITSGQPTPIVPPPEPPPVANSFDFELENSFIFDTIDLYPESLEKYNQKKKQLQKFLEMVINSQLKNTKNTSIAEILNTDVIIEGYASIDGDPNENISKAEKLYEPCRGSGKGTRKDYNLCLSQKRAEYIANDLNNFIGPIKFPDGRTISGAFPNGFKNWAVGVGKGETTQFVDKKWPNTKNTDETAPNRRIVFTPKLVANIKE